MYHISNDKRAVRSAELIYEGLLQCLEKRAFDQITVTDVQKASGVARTTIYRCFDNLSDILFWRCDSSFREAMNPVQMPDAPSEMELMREYFSYWMAHSDILELLINMERQDIIYACHMKNAESLAQSYGTLPGLNEGDVRYFMAIRTGLTISILKAWVEGGRKETEDQLLEILRRQLVFLASSLLK